MNVDVATLITQPSHLKIHLSTHSEGSYKCELCNSLFIQLISLKSYNSTHTRKVNEIKSTKRVKKN